ncbi:MAG: sporulation protein YunB [Clostridia bacterium]|nr:sporulation protein YunB [Clostridia bacterium]
MVAKKLKSNKKRKRIIRWLVILGIVILIFTFFNMYVKPVIINVSEAKVKSLSTQAINSAVQSVINNTNVYDNIIEVVLDSNGKISMFQVNSLEINKLSKEIGKTAQNNMELVSSKGIDIPLGTLSGIAVLVGIGPNINFHINPIGTIQSHFNSEFSTAGINQTNHRIYLTMTATINIVLPTSTRTVTTNSHILICESIIVGEVPDTYLYSSSLDEMLNLI